MSTIKEDLAEIKKDLKDHIKTSSGFREKVVANENDIGWLKKSIWTTFVVVIGRIAALIGLGK